ncbi:MAG TPA: type IV secretory system conjugative DNA transfer family protein [Trebonia sp.]|nr:type IV secretory system conjugative DNA transfer family protein [Trebonia sp.]
MSRSARHDREALFLGRIDRPGRRKWPWESRGALPPADEAVLSAAGQAPHVLTFAPAGAGRGRSCLDPNLLNYAGQAVVLDIGGTAYAATADARRAMGQVVMRLDPFGVAGRQSNAYSPFDWIDPQDMSAFAANCQEIAGLLAPGNPFGTVAEQAATTLLGAILGSLYSNPETHFDDLYSTVTADDPIYDLAVILDTRGKRLHPTSYSQIANFLDKDDKARSRILATAAAIVEPLSNPDVRTAVHDSDFDFPPPPLTTVYVILPAEQFQSNAALARLWIGFLLLRTARAAEKPALPVLFLLDRCAELGPFPVLEASLAAAPTGALRVWTLWDDPQQFRAACPRHWASIAADAGAIQVFATSDAEAAAEAAALLGLPADEIHSLSTADEVVRTGAAASRRVQRLGI